MPLRVVCASSAGRLCPLWGVRDSSLGVCDPRGVCDPVGTSVPPSRAGCDPSQGVCPPHGVPQLLPSWGVSAPPSLGISVSFTGCPKAPHGVFVPPLGREPLISRFTPRGSFPRVPPSFCCGVSGFVPSVCERGAVLPVPRGRGGLFSHLRHCRLRGPPNFPAGRSCAASKGPPGGWRLLGFGGARRLCGTRAIFCFVFYFICHIPFPFHRAGQRRNPWGIAFRGSHSRAPACPHERENE